MVSLGLRELTKVYPDGTRAVDRLSLEVDQGEFIVLLGPSGCGKSTVLRMIAGLEEITAGELRIGHRLANDMPPAQRDIAMVFQSSALYPHFSVRDNLGFALRMARMPPQDIERRVDEVAAGLGLAGYLDRMPTRLSGGERQRVAMGRAIVRRPALFLMDEPLSNLDAQLRVHLRAEISTLTRDLGTTTVYVTHDQAEAMSMGHRVAILRAGVLQQVGTPPLVYDEPANVFVATFIGSPRMNLLEGRVQALRDGGLELDLGAQRLSFQQPLLPDHALLRGLDGQAVIVGLRPDAVALGGGAGEPGGPGGSGPPGRLQAVIRHAEFLGNETLLHLDTGSRPARVPDLAAPEDTHLTHDDPRSDAARRGAHRRGLVGLRRRRGRAAGTEGRAPAAEPDRDGDAAGGIAAPATGDMVARLPPSAHPKAGVLVTIQVDLGHLYVFGYDGRRSVPSDRRVRARNLPPAGRSGPARAESRCERLPSASCPARRRREGCHRTATSSPRGGRHDGDPRPPPHRGRCGRLAAIAVRAPLGRPGGQAARRGTLRGDRGRRGGHESCTVRTAAAGERARRTLGGAAPHPCRLDRHGPGAVS